MSLKRHYQTCNTVKSGRRWRRRPWRFRSETSRAERLAVLQLRFMAQESADYYAAADASTAANSQRTSELSEASPILPAGVLKGETDE